MGFVIVVAAPVVFLSIMLKWLWGSVAFMVSDSLLGYGKFVSPLPVAGLWVLGWFAFHF